MSLGCPSRRAHARYVLRKDNYGAVVEVVWGNEAAYQRLSSNLQNFLSTLKVVSAQEFDATQSTGVGQRSQGNITALVPGLYRGTYKRYQPNLAGGIGGTFFDDTMFYVFSDNGRVHRSLTIPAAPGNDSRGFDFDAALQRDPGNTGTYAVRGDEVLIRLGSDEITGRMLPDGFMEIQGNRFSIVR